MDADVGIIGTGCNACCGVTLPGLALIYTDGLCGDRVNVYICIRTRLEKLNHEKMEKMKDEALGINLTNQTV